LSKEGLNFFISIIPIFNLFKNDLFFKSTIATQYSKLYYNNKPMCDHILKFENLEEEFNDLMKKYNLDYRINGEKYNKIEHDLTFNDISDYNKFLIREFYKNDFEKFNYKE
jgi:hypothetical protein